MNIDPCPLLAKVLLGCLLLMVEITPASAQFKLTQGFEGTTAPGWTFTNSAMLTAPSIDAAGSGWLRLTSVAGNVKGLALNNAFSFGSNQPVSVEFSYVAWGGTGADGMTLFLYDSSVASPMAGALTGGGLGYCGGAGGYLAIGLDEYGNFSNPHDKCTTASGGPGAKPESFVIRGPESTTNAWVTTVAVPGGIDNPHVTTRPAVKTVLLTLTPAVAPAVGYTITAQFQPASGQPFLTLFSNVPFSYAPPANLSVGFSGATGGSTNNHELQGLTAASPDDLQVTMSGPSSVLQGSSAAYSVTVMNNGNYPINAADSPTVIDNLPASITAASWTCVGAGGATCEAAGAGNIDTSNLTLPANGSVTYTITGTVDPNVTCGGTIANSASADFSSSTNFLDPDETNNAATVNSIVTCDQTFVTNPAAVNFGSQTVATAGTAQAITLMEGNNSATISSIAVTGDYTQTNDCQTTLAPAQSCTIDVIFTPSAEGSRSGTLTVLSNPTASATVAAVVMLTGTGTNAVPNAFSFTPLVNVDPSSTQLSNSITVDNTNVPSPISIGSAGQYSINGGAFTSVPGVVSPGAQVQVELAAASGYSTSDSAVLTIGGVSSTFMVTTGAQPVLQGGFTPVTGAAASSVQVSNAITVTGTTIAAPISVSTGSQYAINGGAFSAVAGTIQPGDQVLLQMTAPPTYNTTASAVVNIGGVTSTFTVTTAAQPPQQAAFTAVIGSSISSPQISNPITIVGIAVPASISISSGAVYSINGSPFTSTAGTVQAGDQVRVELTAASTYDSTATAVLSVAGSTSSFAVTTGVEPILQGSFTPTVNSAISSVTVSNSITVTAITSPAAITVSGGAQYRINGGAFTQMPGTVNAGDQVTLQMTAPSTYSTTAAAVLTIDGVTADYAVTTGVAPLQGVAVTGGGGAFGVTTLLLLSLLACLKAGGSRRTALSLPLGIALLVLLNGAPARASDTGALSNWYGGIRVGDSTSSLSAAKLSRDLQADGYQVTATGAERGTASGTLYLGYELPDHFAVELAGTYVGRTRAALEGVLPANLGPLLAAAAHSVRGSGDIVALEARYRWPLATWVNLDLRAGPYAWLTRTDVYVSGVDDLHRAESGAGYTLGLGPRFAWGEHCGLGVGADYFASTPTNHYLVYAATLEYHFR